MKYYKGIAAHISRQMHTFTLPAKSLGDGPVFPCHRLSGYKKPILEEEEFENAITSTFDVDRRETGKD
jgi:hypothetical protein